jgi:hypothetical protein
MVPNQVSIAPAFSFFISQFDRSPYANLTSKVTFG